MGPRAPPPIAAYGAVGDRRSVALIAGGNVDWWCPGRFDAPSVLSRLLDARGGRFLLAPVGPWGHNTAYDGETNVLVTSWEGPTGTGAVHDLMPLCASGAPTMGDGALLRIARCTEGRMRLRMHFEPRPEYGSASANVRPRGPGRATASWRGGQLGLAATRPIRTLPNKATAEWDLRAGDMVAVATGPGRVARPEDPLGDLETTRQWWRAWAGRCHHVGPHRDIVVRSALALGLLTYAPTGAMVAAATTSIPEWPGGTRNWDYRFVWMRDAAFAVDAFHDTGHHEDALRIGRWMHRVLAATPPGLLDVLYHVDGTLGSHERELRHLSGYKGSRPVRVGNGAAGQFQLDVYGELVECLHLCRVLAGDAHEEQDWSRVRAIVDTACRRWREPDQGIWEMRGPPRHFVLSKVMSWVAVDRGLRAVRDLGLPGPGPRWEQEAQEIRNSILEHGFSPARNAFVQAYGSEELDASNLLLPILGFLPGDDPRIVGTIDAVQSELMEEGLVHRYREVDDGVGGPQATFAACSFWLVEALAQAGRRPEAHYLMGRLMRLAGPLGLYAQSLGPGGEHLGNYPQALTHIALIGAAVALDHADRSERPASSHLRHVRR